MENPHPFEDAINVFSDDMYRYLLPRRIPVFHLAQPVARAPGTRSVFRPEVGICVLCECYRQQHEFIVHFEEHYPEFVQDTRSFMTFCATYAVKLIEELEDNVLKAAVVIASMILELGTFCHVRGHPRFKYYLWICWADIFKFYLSLNFFTRYCWDDLLLYAKEDIQFYMQGNFELPLDENRVEYRSDWLRTFDYGTAVYYPGMRPEPFRIRTPTPTEEVEAAAQETAEVPLPEVSEETIDTQAEVPTAPEISEEMVDTQAEVSTAPEVSETSEQAAVPPTDDTSIPVPKQPTAESVPEVRKKRKPIAEFKRMIYEGDSPSQLLEILENRKRVDLLMRSDVFQSFVNETVENPEEKLDNKNILEFVRLILLGNDDLAKFYVRSTRYLKVTHEIRRKAAELTDAREQDSVAPARAASSSAPDKSKGAIPKRRKRTAVDRTRKVNELDEKLVKEFKRVVSAARDHVSKEICDNFEFPFNQKVLLDNAVFRSIMDLTVKFPVRRWGNEWILTFMKSIIGAAVQPGSPSKAKSTRESSAQESETVQSSTSDGSSKESGASDQSKKMLPGVAPDPTRPDDDDIDSNPDSDEEQGDSKTETVYVDIVNLSSSFKQLLVDVVKEGSVPQGAEGQAKSSSKRKRRNRKRSKRTKPETSLQPVKENPYEPPLQPSPSAISEGFSSQPYGEGDLFNIIQGVASMCGTGQNLDWMSEEASSNRGTGRKVTEERSGDLATPAEPTNAAATRGQVTVAKADSTTPTVSAGASALPTGSEMEATGHESAEDSENADSGLQKLFDMIPSSRSDEVLDWIFREILSTKPNFFETLEDKDIDEDTKKELMKYRERFPGSEK